MIGDCVIAKRSNTALIGIDLKNPANEWQLEVGEIAGAPALKHGLMFLAIASPVPQLLCLDDSSRIKLWSADLGSKPLGGPSISGDKVYVAITGKNGTGASILCRSLTDGHTIWESSLEKIPISPLALSSDHLAFTADDGTVIVLENRTGEQSHTVPLGKGGQAPAIYQQTIFLCATGRIGAYDLATSSWLWGYRDQKQIGAALTAPILANEAVWISTDKQGLLSIGGKDATKR